MAALHIPFNDQTKYGGQLRNALTLIEDGFDRLKRARDTLQFMRDGDGSQAAHYAGAVSPYGFADAAGAKAAFDELASVLSKLETDASVSNVNAALLQVLKKLR
jgi:hypothetical protein